MKSRFTNIVLLLALFLAGCAPASANEPVTLNVFAAASLTDAFTEIGANFDAANAGVTTTFNFAGSQALRTQIQEGAPVDVFASANNKEMTTLIEGSFVTAESAQVFLSNKLVVILPANNPAGIDSLEDLANAGIKIVFAAEEVPVGRYTREALDLMNGSFGPDFKDKVLANVVSNEDNVKQVVAKVQLGEADAGIVYTSDAVAAPELQTIEIPTDLNVIAKYPIAPLAESANAELAQAFVDYVLSDEGQAILQKWGFASP
ncbi:MAG: molybdate ABC transporter substrate-binding protein [Anaerolineae bacterium]|nr:MAG: molybdate ABC transporter substrate-binding protein [Anaerolineae bacterium]WKZ43511.1 MAG: molybdate ABC transporter substrate-binding protein [Anaerolineales bacterium]